MILVPELKRRARPAAVGHAAGGCQLLHGTRRSLRDFAPVLALSILRQVEGRSEILVGVRDPLANKTHPNVASVPTRRVASVLADDWRRRLRRDPTSAKAIPGLRNEVSSILSQKVGLADALERRDASFELRGLVALQGLSIIGEDDTGEPQVEALTMFNVGVVLNQKDSLHVPASTGSYSHLVWANLEKFTHMTRQHDVGLLDAGLEEAFACAYGMCLESSLKLLESTGILPY